ncbi:hypothetical protein [Streptomyces sp. NPDC003395]
MAEPEFTATDVRIDGGRHSGDGTRHRAAPGGIRRRVTPVGTLDPAVGALGPVTPDGTLVPVMPDGTLVPVTPGGTRWHVTRPGAPNRATPEGSRRAPTPAGRRPARHHGPRVAPRRADPGG